MRNLMVGNVTVEQRDVDGNMCYTELNELKLHKFTYFH